MSEGEYKILTRQKESLEIASSAAKQQVQVPHDGQEDATPFSVDRVYFRPDEGLYVILEIQEEGIREPLRAAWNLLSEDGLGTDRTTGAGQFIATWEKGGFHWPKQSFTDHQTNLSLYWPRQEEVDVMSDARYALLRRGGFIAQADDLDHLSIRKRAVYMLAEGSVFPANRNLLGRLGDLRPAAAPLEKAGVRPVGHPVWRDGQALFLPL